MALRLCPRTYSRSREELEQMLFEVVDELNLSDGMIEEHGPRGTSPAELVRLVLARKDQEIWMLKAGFVDITPRTKPHMEVDCVETK